MTYLLLKFVHVASVVVFLGNILTGLFWTAHANRSRDFTIIATTFDGIIRSDRLMTVPGVIGILVSGFAAAIFAGLPILGTGWIFWPIVLFSISGLVFGVYLAPLQRQLRDFAQSVEYSDSTWRDYMAMYMAWERWGLLAIATPALALAIMVLKPGVPGL